MGVDPRRLVRGLLLGADGGTVRARRDEHRLDGADRLLIAVEKLLPWRAVATAGSRSAAGAAFGVAASPANVPGLTIPTEASAMGGSMKMGAEPKQAPANEMKAPMQAPADDMERMP